MQRVLLLVTGLSLLAAAFGCHHTHGICDCELPAAGPSGPVPHYVGAPVAPFGTVAPDVTYPGAPGIAYPSTAVPTTTPEVIRSMPKAIESGK
jgi:hypothetical protein